VEILDGPAQDDVSGLLGVPPRREQISPVGGPLHGEQLRPLRPGPRDVGGGDRLETVRGKDVHAGNPEIAHGDPPAVGREPDPRGPLLLRQLLLGQQPQIPAVEPQRPVGGGRCNPARAVHVQPPDGPSQGLLPPDLRDLHPAALSVHGVEPQPSARAAESHGQDASVARELQLDDILGKPPDAIEHAAALAVEEVDGAGFLRVPRPAAAGNRAPVGRDGDGEDRPLTELSDRRPQDPQQPA